MRRPAWWSGGVLVTLIGFGLSSTALAWEIERFETDIQVHEDATSTVQETITANFGDESRHGIYRDIPVLYTDRAGQRFRLRLAIREVTDGSGRRWPYRLESPGRYLRLRIGDPEQTVTGTHTYHIVYNVQRGAVRFFPDHDECYWNLTGNEWAIPMQRVHGNVVLPEAARELRAVAYIGAYGSTERVDQLRLLPHQVIVDVNRPLGSYEGLTVAVAWAKDVVHPPSPWRVAVWWLQDNWIYGLPILVLVGMWALWFHRGRDPWLSRSMVVQYEPPDGLTPAELGALIDQQVDLRDVTSTVIDLAVRGYLRIELKQHQFLGNIRTSEYRLVSLRPWQDDSRLKLHERLMLAALFTEPLTSRDLSDLEEVFYQRLPGIRQAIAKALADAHYFDGKPDDVRARYVFLAALVTFGPLVLIGWLEGRLQLPTAPVVTASLLSGVIVLCFSRIMPRRTMKGAQTTERLLGFVEFLQRTDADRAKRMNDPHLFERCLPYALAFGVAGQWARAFEGLYTQPPSWYGGSTDAFSVRGFSRDVERATTSMGRSFTTAPRSQGGSSGSWGGSGFGGGGSSGGGGGGGGGGSW